MVISVQKYHSVYLRLSTTIGAAPASVRPDIARNNLTGTEFDIEEYPKEPIWYFG